MSPTAGADPQTRAILGFRVLGIVDPKVRRIAQLTVGLLCFGLGVALGVEAELGVSPWTVFHQGAADRIGISIGVMVQLTGLAILLSFRPLREPLGLGTLMNVIVIGAALDTTLWLIPDLTNMGVRLIALAAAPVVIGLASGLYIGAGLGPGPRDGLMTALERRGVRVSIARTLIELTALGTGWLLGGDVGLGTVWIAVSTGWFVGVFLPRLRVGGVSPRR